MKLIQKWKEGLEPCFRLVFVGFFLNILVIPVGVTQRIEFSHESLNAILSIIYLFMVIPVCMPWIFKISGLQLDKKNCEGGMNEASEEKQASLNQETNGG